MTQIQTKQSILKLIKEAEAQFSGTGKSLLDIEDYVAEYLTANGVIVPPCKLGDTVLDGYDPKWTYTVSQITQKANGTLKIRLTSSRSRSVHEIEPDDIGNYYFLSREEAEKALAERSKKDGI